MKRSLIAAGFLATALAVSPVAAQSTPRGRSSAEQTKKVPSNNLQQQSMTLLERYNWLLESAKSRSIGVDIVAYNLAKPSTNAQAIEIIKIIEKRTDSLRRPLEKTASEKTAAVFERGGIVAEFDEAKALSDLARYALNLEAAAHRALQGHKHREPADRETMAYILR
jgi:hypothetical protein